MAKLLEFLDRHTARNLFRSSHLNTENTKMAQYVYRTVQTKGHFLLEFPVFLNKSPFLSDTISISLSYKSGGCVQKPNSESNIDLRFYF